MKTCKNILLSALVLFSFSSCSDWFEVQPENEIAKEDLFASYDGYRTALNGIYRNLSDASLYGNNLSFGFTVYWDRIMMFRHIYSRMMFPVIL